MAQIEFQPLTTEWTALSDIITVEDDTTYYIQNRGAGTLIAQEGASQPDAENQNGVLITPYRIAQYKKGSEDLYLRAFDQNCSINITSEA